MAEKKKILKVKFNDDGTATVRVLKATFNLLEGADIEEDPVDPLYFILQEVVVNEDTIAAFGTGAEDPPCGKDWG